MLGQKEPDQLPWTEPSGVGLQFRTSLGLSGGKCGGIWLLKVGRGTKL